MNDLCLFGSPTVAAITSCVSTNWGFLKLAALRCFPDKQQPFLCKLWAFILNHVHISWLLTQDSQISYISKTRQRFLCNLWIRERNKIHIMNSYDQDLRLETTYSIWESLHMDLFLPTPGFIFLYFKAEQGKLQNTPTTHAASQIYFEG